MMYMELPLKKNGKDNNYDSNEYYLKLALEQNNFIVLLGSPGSGKTSLLKKYKDETPFAEYMDIKMFLRLSKDVLDSTEVLFLDALDEYRSSENDKNFVTTILGDRINKILLDNQKLKVVITCREMDWYGESDKTALKEQISCEVGVFNILPLSIKKQKEMIEILNVDNSEEFFKTFSNRGFLENPQLLKLLSEIWKSRQENLSSKFEIYNEFIMLAKENNSSNKLNKRNLDDDLRIRIIGYLAFYYIFSDIDDFSNEVLDKISDKEAGFSRENLEKILNTGIFSEKRFIHRTIAEFSLAKFLCDYKLEAKLDIARIKGLFVKNGMIPTELRGAYAWLCSISNEDSFILVDPYYQAIHGDNSLFSTEKKKKILSAVRDYSKLNPYFYEWEHRMELEGFYEPDLDEILIKECEQNQNGDTHYIYFIINIIIQSNNHSEKMKEFVKDIIMDKTPLKKYKYHCIEMFADDVRFLLEVLKLANNGKISDENERIKENILNKLYPEYVNTKEILEFLNLSEHKKDYVGQYYFLHKTLFEDKFELVDGIFKKHDCKEDEFILSDKISFFVEEYFLEYLLKYNNGKSAKEIYDFIYHFNNYYPEYQTIDIGSRLNRNEENDIKKLDGLADELFQIFIEETLKENKSENWHGIYFDFIDFYKYTSLANAVEIILSFINDSQIKEQNQYLYKSLLNICNEKDKYRDIFENIANKFGFESQLDLWLNPPKQEWEIKSELRKKERKEKDDLIKKQNEDYFSGKSDEEILNNFNALNWISGYYYLKNDNKEINDKEKYISNITLKKLKEILKKLIYEVKDNELATINSLLENSPNALRCIDSVYYTSLALNNEENVLTSLIENIDFKKYLYILSVRNNQVGGIIESNFCEKIEFYENFFAKETMKESIKLYVNYNSWELRNIFLRFIEREEKFERLKRIICTFELNSFNRFYDILIKIYGVELNTGDLESLLHESMNDENMSIINSLLKFNKNEKERFEKKDAVNLFYVFKGEFSEYFSNFKNADSGLKVKILNYLMDCFSTEKSIAFVDGFQSTTSECGEFLKQNALSLLNLEELQELLTFYNDNSNIWKNRILSKMSELKQKNSDNEHQRFDISSLKKFILKDSIISYENFFIEVYHSLEELKNNIEDNRDNELNMFYKSSDGEREEACRDIIFTRLKDRHEKYFELIKEKHEADNRVDINIKYKKNMKYEIQIECKVDDNKDLYNGINNQLIDKYFSSGVKYGIYLVFYYGNLNPKGKKDKERMMTRLENEIPLGHKDNIKVICIDLKK